MGLNVSNFSALLKETFDERQVANLTYRRNRLLALLPKITSFDGTDVKVPILYGSPQSIGPFSNAQTAKTSTQTSSAAFTLYRRKKYGVVTIDGETIKASQNSPGAFLEAKTTEIKGIISALARDLAIDLYRDGTGVLGTCVSGQATPTITLASKAEARNFEVGMWVNVVHSGAVIGAPSKAQITKVDTSAATLTISGNWTATFATMAAGDTIVRDGCFSVSGSTTSYPVMEGLASYCPLTAPTSTLFYGVDRTAHTTRLGGVRITTQAGQPIEEIFIDLMTAIVAEGGLPDLCLLSPENYGALIKSLGAKKTYSMESTKRAAVGSDGEQIADIGFSGVKVFGGGAEIDVIPDNACPNDRMFMLQTDTWAVRTIGNCPTLLDDVDGLVLLREAASDGYEVRAGYYGNLQCNAPGFNGSASIS